MTPQTRRRVKIATITCAILGFALVFGSMVVENFLDRLEADAVASPRPAITFEIPEKYLVPEARSNATQTTEETVVLEQVQIEPVVATPSLSPDNELGKQTYNRTCFSCHETGIANAPRLDSPELLVRLSDKGYASLVHNTLTGIGAMPPKGGAATFSDAQIEAGVRYMVDVARARAL